ncbi:MAG: hypothetical protein NTW87_04355 [Planctomycetota bacterium]|nr:hypothetical protein [Planctomycetota bacterium]
MKANHGSYTRDDVARIAEGAGASTIWFGGGRLGISVADHGGVEEIVYFGKQPLGRREFFRSSARSAYPRLFRTSLIVDGRTYLLELNQTEVFPGGYRSRLDVAQEGVSIEHWLIVVNDAPAADDQGYLEPAPARVANADGAAQLQSRVARTPHMDGLAG